MNNYRTVVSGGKATAALLNASRGKGLKAGKPEEAAASAGLLGKALRVVFSAVLVVSLLPVLPYTGLSTQAYAVDAPAFRSVSMQAGAQVSVNGKSTSAVSSSQVVANATSAAVVASDISSVTDSFIQDQYGSDALGTSALSNAGLMSLSNVNSWKSNLASADKAYWLSDTKNVSGLGLRAYANADNTQDSSKNIVITGKVGSSEYDSALVSAGPYAWENNTTLSSFTVQQSSGTWDLSRKTVSKFDVYRAGTATFDSGATVYNNPYLLDSGYDSQGYKNTSSTTKSMTDDFRERIFGIVKDGRIVQVQPGQVIPAGTVCMYCFRVSDGQLNSPSGFACSSESYTAFFSTPHQVFVGEYLESQMVYGVANFHAGMTTLQGDTLSAGSYGIRPAMDLAVSSVSFVRPSTSSTTLDTSQALGGQPGSSMTSGNTYKLVVPDASLTTSPVLAGATTDKGAVTVEGSTIKVPYGSTTLTIPVATGGGANYVSALANTYSGDTKYGVLAAASAGSATVDLSGLVRTSTVGSTAQVSLYAEDANGAGMTDGISATPSTFTVEVDYGDPHTITYDADGGTGTTLPASVAHRYGETLSAFDGSALAVDNKTFDAWKMTLADGTTQYIKAGQTFTMPDEDITLKACYQGVNATKDTDTEGVVEFEVTYTADAGGTVSPATQISESDDYGNITGSTATPDADHVFDGWYKGDTKISSNATLSAADARAHLNGTSGAYEDTAYTAKFAAIGVLKTLDEQWWGTLTPSAITSVTFSRTAPASYTGTWDAASSGTVTGYAVGTDVYLVSPRAIRFPEDSSGLFKDLSACSSFNFGNMVDTSNVTNMGAMFVTCTSLTSLNLSSFDTSKVTDMSAMFVECSNLTSLNLSSFDTSKVTNTGYMFHLCNADCTVYCRSASDKATFVNSVSSNLSSSSFIVGSPNTLSLSSLSDEPDAALAQSDSDTGNDDAASDENESDAESSTSATGSDTSAGLFAELLSPEKAYADNTVSTFSAGDIVDKGKIVKGEEVDYSVTVNYEGVGKSGLVTVTDVLPANMIYVGGSAASVTSDTSEHVTLTNTAYDSSTRTLTLQFKGLSTGKAATIAFKARVTDDATSLGKKLVEYVNQASATSGGSTAVTNGTRHYSGTRDTTTYPVTYEYTGDIPASASALPSSVSYSADVDVQVAPAPTVQGYEFSGWSVKSGSATIENGSFTMPAGEVVLSGTWTKLPTFSVAYDWQGRSGGLSGAISVADLPASLSTADASTIVQGGTVALPAYPQAGATTATAVAGDPYADLYDDYVFLGWSVDTHALSDAERDAGEFTPTDNVTITGNWERRSFEVSYAYDPTSTGAALPSSQSVKWGETFDVASDPTTTGYRFLGWTVPESAAASGSSYIMPRENVVVTGTWEQLYQVSVTNGTVGEGSSAWFSPGDTVTIRPSEIAGVKFNGWDLTGITSGDLTFADDNAATFTMPATSVTAQARYGIEVTFSIENGIWETGGYGGDRVVLIPATKGSGDSWTATLSASDVPSTMVSFASYDPDSGAWDVNPLLNTTITAPVTYTYSYAPFNEIAIGYRSEDASKGSVKLNGSVETEADSVSERLNPSTGVAVGATAEAKKGYLFSGWTFEDATQVLFSTASLIPEKFRLSGSDAALYQEHTYVARFSGATDTAYAVEYYRQGETGDTYTLVATDTTGKTGTTDEAPALDVEAGGADAKAYAGCASTPAKVTYATSTVAESVTPQNIAADGSLVIRVYYDRNGEQITADDFALSLSEAQALLDTDRDAVTLALLDPSLNDAQKELCRLAQARAISTISGFDVAIASVDYEDLQALRGTYAITFATAAGTATTVQASVKDASAEDFDTQERIVANNISFTYGEAGELLAKSDGEIAATLRETAEAYAWSTLSGDEVKVANVDWAIRQEEGVYDVTFATEANTAVTIKASVGPAPLSAQPSQDPSQESSRQATVQTGDDADLLLMALVTFIAGGALITVVARGRLQRKDRGNKY